MLTFTTLKKIKHHVPLEKGELKFEVIYDWDLVMWRDITMRMISFVPSNIVCTRRSLTYLSTCRNSSKSQLVVPRGRFIWPTGNHHTKHSQKLPITNHCLQMAVQHLAKLLHSDIVNTLTGPEVHYLVQSRNVRPPCEVWWKVHNSSQDHKQWVAGCWNLIVVWRLLKYI